MASSSDSDDEGSSTTAFVASILGLKGALRFRAHGSTQKAHVILRRIVSPADSGDHNGVSRVVRFSLFAQKRIDVKPGKEILLCVATENGSFKDIPLVLESDPTSVAFDGSRPHVAEDDEEDVYCPPVRQIVPPKIRRTWTKKVEDTAFSADPVPTRVSIGVQATPESTSRAVEAVPEARSVSIQATPLTASVSIQAISSSAGASVQAQPCVESTTTRKMASGSQVGEETEKRRDMSTDGEAEMDLSDSGQRSLSPMELDSVPSSGASTPVTSYFPASITTTQSSLPMGSASPVQNGDVRPRTTSPPQKLTADWGSMYPPENIDDYTWTDGFPAPLPSLTSCPSHLENWRPSGKIQTRQKSQNSMESAQPRIKQEVEEPKIPPPSLKRICDMFVPAKISISTGPGNVFDTIPTDTTFIKREETEESGMTSSTAASKQDEDRGQHRPSMSRPDSKVSSSKIKSVSAGIPPGPRSMLIPIPSAIDPAHVAHPTSGPLSNPLNIGPSTVRTIASKPPPAGPQSLQNTSSKKPVVIGTAWSAAKSLPSSSVPESVESRTVKKKSRRRGGESSSGNSQQTTVANYSDFPPPPTTPPHPPPITPTLKRKSVPPNEPTPTIVLSNVEQNTNALPDKKVLPCTMANGVDPNQSRLEILPTLFPSPTTDSSRKSPESTDPSSSSYPSISTIGTSNICETPSVLAPKIEPYSDFFIPAVQRDVSLYVKKVASPKASSQTHFAEIIDLTISPPPSEKPALTAHRASLSSTKTSIPSSSQPLPLTHPLPPKPTQPAAAHPGSSYRGVKRERPQSPDLSRWRDNRTPPRRRSRVDAKFPTIESSNKKVLQGDGEPSLQTINFSSDGSYFVLSCSDRTIRVWNTRDRLEMARLTHHSPIINAFWLENDAGVIALTDDGLVSKWTKTGDNAWKWAKVMNAGNDYRSEQDPICFAYMRDRLAVSFPRMGVKVWIWSKGVWLPQRSILRQNVTAIKFIDDGAALLGGTRDGALWYCETPNGTLRAYAFLKTKIISLDVSPLGTHVLVAAAGGSASLVALRKAENKGHIEKIYSCKDRDDRGGLEFGAAFATKGQGLLFASVDSCVLVWDRKKGSVVYGLEHDEDDCIQAVATTDSIAGRDGCMITGTSRGQLCWWALPVAAGESPGGDAQKKRQKVEM